MLTIGYITYLVYNNKEYTTPDFTEQLAKYISATQHNYSNPKKVHDNLQQNSAEKYFIWSAFAGVLDILSSQKSAL